MNINDLTVEQVKELATLLSGNKSSAENLDNFALGETVIIRTYSAGVWCGTLDKKAGKEVILKNARRMWRWKCAKSISLSGIVKYGIDAKESIIAPPIDFIWLEAIEIMPIFGEAAKSVMDAPYAEAK